MHGAVPQIDDRYPVCITVEYLPTIEQRTALVSWNVAISSAEYFRYAPAGNSHVISLLAAYRCLAFEGV